MNLVTLADNNEGLSWPHWHNPFKAVEKAVVNETHFVVNNPLRAVKDTVGLGITLENKLTQAAIPAALNLVVPGSGAVVGGIAKNVFGKITDLEYKALAPTGIRPDQGAEKFFNNKIVSNILTATADVAGGVIGGGGELEDLAVNAAKKLGGQLLPTIAQSFIPKQNLPTYQMPNNSQQQVITLPTPKKNTQTASLVAGLGMAALLYMAKIKKII